MRSANSAVRALVAGVAATMVAVACGSTSSPPASVDVGSGSITGAGATFPQPFYAAAFFAYTQQYSKVTVNYQAVGSGAGIQQFIKNTVDFGASDVPMGSSDITSAGGPDVLTQIPTTLGVIAVAYNVQGLSSLNL